MIPLLFLASGVTKLLGLFGNGLLNTINNKMTQETARQGIWVGALGAAVKAEVDMRAIASNERVALWGDKWYRLLVYLIVAPPALHMAGIYIDTLFSWVWIPLYGYVPIDWHIPPPPSPYKEWGTTIVLTFIGGGASVAAIVNAAKQFKK